MGEPDPNARLEARLQRERRARQEAEQIAEQSLLRLYRTNQALELVAGVTALANETAGWRDALAGLLPMLVRHGDWAVAHVFLPDPDDSGILVGSDIWHSHGETFDVQVELASAGTRVHRGEGLVGRAMTGPVWVSDLSESPSEARQGIAQGSACAFPILADQEVVAVVELLHPSPAPEDEEFLRLAGTIGVQLGLVKERAVHSEREADVRRRLADEVRQRTADLMAERAKTVGTARARESLQSALSHELLTPLHTVLSSMDGARDSGPEQFDHYCRLAHSAGDELRQKVSRLLALMDAPAGRVDPVVAHPLTALEPAIGAFTQLLEDDGREMPISVDPSADSCLLFDGSALTAAFEAAVSLAIANSNTGPVTGYLSMSGGALRIEVSCTTAERISSIHIVEQIAAAAGGSAAEKLENGRTTVFVRLPAAPTITDRHGEGNRILLVEDTEVTRQLGTGIIRSLGYEVDVASDGFEAIDAARTREYGLILMDIGLPHLDGMQTARAIRSGGAGRVARRTPIIALTAQTGAADRLRSRVAGMDDFVTKPFTRGDLAPVLAKYVPMDAGAPVEQLQADHSH